MKKVIAITISFIILFCFNTAIAKGKKEVIDNSPLIPFDINVEKLPPNFAGTDIVKLFSMLSKKAPLKKEEFETTADYEKKITAAVTDDVYAFKLPDDKFFYGLNICPYNADTQKLPIQIKTTRHSEFVNRSSIIIKSIDKKSSYVGSNAFGAKTKVLNYSGEKYGIVLVNQEEFGIMDDKTAASLSIETGNRTIDIEIEMTPDKAKKLKDNIGAILLCKARLFKLNEKEKKWYIIFEGNDLIFKDFIAKEATFDHPSSFSYERYFINVEALSIWVYDIKNGEIILKKDL